MALKAYRTEHVDTRADCPYRNLWKAVFMQVIRDALSDRPGQRRTAMAWLFGELYRKNRTMVMDRAGITMDGWEEKMRAALCSKHYPGDIRKAIDKIVERHYE